MSAEMILQSADGQRLVAEVSRQSSIPPQQAQTVLQQMLTPIVAGIARNTASRGGVAALMRALGSGNHAAALDNPASLADPATVADGKAILAHILGSQGKAEAAMQRVAQEERLPLAAAQQLMPMLAVFLMGWLYRNGGPALGGVLEQTLGTPAQAAFGSDGPLSMPRMPGSGGPGSGSTTGGTASGGVQLPDLGDIFGGSNGGQAESGGPFRRGGTMGDGPLSMPDLDRIRRNRGGRAPSDNPYGDLGDIVKGGGGGTAGSIRDILGGLLGFKTGGWMGWIIKMVVLRYGWQILGFVVRRLFLRT
jgi:hypothetical protein